MLKLIITIIFLTWILWLFYTEFDAAFGKDDEVQTACTLEAKMCPDGTAVGRSGPNCEFTACPTE